MSRHISQHSMDRDILLRDDIPVFGLNAVNAGERVKSSPVMGIGPELPSQICNTRIPAVLIVVLRKSVCGFTSVISGHPLYIFKELLRFKDPFLDLRVLQKDLFEHCLKARHGHADIFLSRHNRLQYDECRIMRIPMAEMVNDSRNEFKHNSHILSCFTTGKCQGGKNGSSKNSKEK